MQSVASRTDKKTDEALNGLRAAFDAIDVGVAVIDDATNVLVSNERFYAMLERGGLLAKAYAGEDHASLSAAPLDEIAPGLRTRPTEARGPAGRVFEISYKMDPAGFHGTLIQVRDVTGQVIDAGAVDSAREQAELIERARTAFVSQVAHHFRTPLHVILGYVDILADADDGTLDRSSRDTYLQFIRESASALLLNMNEMMEIIRIQRDEMEAEFESRDVSNLLASVLSEVEPVFTAEGVTIEACQAIEDSKGGLSLIDIRLARRGLASLLRTCAVLGGEDSQLQMASSIGEDRRVTLTLSFQTGRATPSDVIDSIENGEPVKEISLTGRASGYGIVLAVLLLRECNAEVRARSSGERDLEVEIVFPSPSTD